MYIYTAILGVKGSYPEAPEAKQTPVARSVGLRLGSKYAGKYSLIPNSSTTSQTNRLQIANQSMPRLLMNFTN